ncbi:UNVERIFIED_CONTAM: hypothetical protein FKN15_076938 [Acipenser sinensis]
MMVSCQSQNFSAVPAGIPYDSQRVFLQNNRITELRAQSFGFQTQVLWLYSNNISSIKPDSFSDMRDLEELDLGDNPSLRTLHPDSFRGLDKLQSLHIYRCQLGTLPGNIFKKLYSLQFLYLQDNLLQHIQVREREREIDLLSNTVHLQPCSWRAPSILSNTVHLQPCSWRAPSIISNTVHLQPCSWRAPSIISNTVHLQPCSWRAPSIISNTVHLQPCSWRAPSIISNTVHLQPCSWRAPSILSNTMCLNPAPGAPHPPHPI